MTIPKKQVALISGGASGIGRTIAELFLKNDWDVHINDISKDNIQDFLIKNPNATATLADIGNNNEIEKTFNDFNSLYKRLDTLILNAGISGPNSPIENIHINDWQRCIDVNLTGMFYIVRQAIPLLKKTNSSSIIGIASNAGIFGCPNRSPYVATKWAMIGLIKTWAMELGPFNIRVNAVCPASVEGPRIERVIDSDAEKRGMTSAEIRDIYKKQSSMQTFVTANDVSEMVAFLASDKSSKISGQAIAIDGNTETLGNWLDK